MGAFGNCGDDMSLGIIHDCSSEYTSSLMGSRNSQRTKSSIESETHCIYHLNLFYNKDMNQDPFFPASIQFSE